jgi:hypothetical protein
MKKEHTSNPKTILFGKSSDPKMFRKHLGMYFFSASRGAISCFGQFRGQNNSCALSTFVFFKIGYRRMAISITQSIVIRKQDDSNFFVDSLLLKL